MEKNLNKMIVLKILKTIPKNIKPVNFLMDTLNLSDKSAYRRIRGEIPFTFNEVIKLSHKLKFSIDEITMQNKERAFFDLNISPDPSETFLIMLQKHYELTQILHNAENVQSLTALNYIPVSFTVLFNNLFKFSYYRWTHQQHKTSLSYYYSDTIIPPKVASLQRKIETFPKTNHNNTYILDPYFFLNTLQEVQYYYRSGFITHNELELIKADMLRLIDLIEELVQQGAFNSKAKFYFYLLGFNLKSSSNYTIYNENILSQFMMCSINTITIYNSEACFTHKKWLDTLKKYSVLITQSNESLQLKFFTKQREYINNIMEVENELVKSPFLV